LRAPFRAKWPERGLGLAIVKHYRGTPPGRMEIHLASPATGSQFSVILPVL